MRTRTHRMRAAMLFLLVPLLLLSMSSVAHAALIGRGPLKTTAPGKGFPLWYQDIDGTAVMLNLVGDPPVGPTLSEPPIATDPASVARGFAAEGFYWAANSATVDVPGGGTASLILGLEATPNPDIVFFRLRVDGRGLQAGGSYTFDHPWGTTPPQTADDTGRIAFTIDADLIDFDGPLGPLSPIDGPFLRGVGAPAGFLGNGTPTTVTGGTVRNAFVVTGVAGTVSTDQFTVIGKLFVPITSATLTAGGAPLMVGGSTSQPTVNATFSTLQPNPAAPLPVNFSVDGGPTRAFTGAAVPISGEGVHTIRMSAVTPAVQTTIGVEPMLSRTVTFGIDTTAPMVEHAFTSGIGGGTFFITGRDAVSGVTSMAYHVDKNLAVTVPGGASTAIPIKPGQHTVTFWSFDRLGHKSAVQTVTVQVKGKPNLTLPKISPASPRRNRTFTMSGKVGHPDVGRTRMSFVIQRRVGNRWVAYKTVRTTLVTGKTSFSAKTKLARRGTFRVRTTHAEDAVHIAGVSKWKTFRVR